MFNHDHKEKIKRIKRIKDNCEIYVLGENSDASTDSRHFGTIPTAAIKAKIIWPRHT